MRPIRLKFSGLHSYIQPADVDFERAIKNGIFGILGKTGHGKSTILDAITFALYGRIERLGNNIHDAVNPKVGKIDVEFIFEVGSERYRIRRTYDGKNARVTAYRWTGGQWIPKAEKQKEVREFVHRRLGGLSFNDFTRVVILPQGKFASFLELQGSKRAEMLERIFNLELYGQPLWETVRDARIELNAKLESIKRMLESKADATPTALRALKDEYAALQRLIGILERGLNELEKKREQFARITQLQERLRQATERLKAHLVKKDEIDRLRKELKTANEIAHLENVFARFKSLSEELPKLERELSELEAKRKAKLDELEKARSQFTQFEAQFRREIEEISRLREKASSASSMMKELEADRREFRELGARIRKLQGEIERIELRQKEMDASISPVEKELQTLDQRIREGQQRIDEFRKSVAEGVEREVEMDYRRLEESRAEFRKLRQKLEEAMKVLAMQWAEFFGDAPPDDPSEIERELEARKQQLEHKVEELENRQKELELQDQAAVLAQSLEEGKPCPVCGAVHHPSPAVRVDSIELKSVKKELKQLKKRLKEFDRFMMEMLRLTSDAKNITGRLDELKEKGKELRQRIALALKIASDDPKLDSRTKEFLKRVDEVNRLAKEVAAAHRERAKLQKRLDGLRAKSEQLTRQLSQLREQKAGLEARKTMLQKKISETEQKIHELIGDNDPNELVEELDERQAGLEEKNQRLKERLDALSNEVERLNSKIERLKATRDARKADLEKVTETLSAEASARGVSIETLESQIRSAEERKAMEETIRSWDETRSRFENEVERLNAELDEFEIDPAYASGMFEKVKGAIQKLKNKLSGHRHKLGELSNKIAHIKKELDEVKRLKKELKEIEPQADMLERLEKTLHGKALVKFASRFLLSEIIVEANRLLDRLVTGRLSLSTPDENLDFVIVDHISGSSRPAKTLSGGEKFMVSFALALALSNYIQRARSRPIDFFFIDEGFGTLDRESQFAVGQVLEEMMREGRVVGLITHVETYRELLPAYFQVIKDEEHGSRVRYVGP